MTHEELYSLNPGTVLRDNGDNEVCSVIKGNFRSVLESSATPSKAGGRYPLLSLVGRDIEVLYSPEEDYYETSSVSPADIKPGDIVRDKDDNSVFYVYQDEEGFPRLAVVDSGSCPFLVAGETYPNCFLDGLSSIVMLEQGPEPHTFSRPYVSLSELREGDLAINESNNEIVRVGGDGLVEVVAASNVKDAQNETAKFRKITAIIEGFTPVEVADADSSTTEYGPGTVYLDYQFFNEVCIVTDKCSSVVLRSPDPSRLGHICPPGYLQNRADRVIILEKVLPESKESDVLDYIAAEKASGLKAGDRVRVIRGADDGERGWNNTWASCMDAMIGDIGVIREIFPDGSGVCLEGDDFGYPFFVLEKLNYPETGDIVFHNGAVLQALNDKGDLMLLVSAINGLKTQTITASDYPYENGKYHFDRLEKLDKLVVKKFWDAVPEIPNPFSD